MEQGLDSWLEWCCVSTVDGDILLWCGLPLSLAICFLGFKKWNLGNSCAEICGLAAVERVKWLLLPLISTYFILIQISLFK